MTKKIKKKPKPEQELIPFHVALAIIVVTDWAVASNVKVTIDGEIRNKFDVRRKGKLV